MKSLDAAEFLSLVWPQSLLRNETLELRAIRRSDKTISRKFLKTTSEFLTAARAFGKGWDIYFGVSTRNGKGGKKTDCLRINAVWIDFDNISELPNFKQIQPDIIVNSGGGFHTYWLLETPIYVQTGRWKEIEAINRGLIKRFGINLKPADKKLEKFGADIMTVDIARILRVPDFFNYKYDPPRKVIANAVHP